MGNQFELPEEKAWWYLRWIYYGDESMRKHVEYREHFINNNLKNPKFHNFITYDQAKEIASSHRNKVVVFLSDTNPGNITIIKIKRNGQHFIKLHNIQSKKSLEDIVHTYMDGKLVSFS